MMTELVRESASKLTRPLSAGARRTADSGFHQPVHHHRNIGGDRMLHRYHVEITGRRRVQRGNDLAQPLQVVGVVGDHQ